MQNGIYHVNFSSPQGTAGDGLVVIKDGAVNGGDHGYLYLGQLRTESGQVSGQLDIKRWNQGVPSIFGPLGDFKLQLTGAANNDVFTVTGNVTSQPNLKITISGRRVSEAA